ncbi:histidine phosphatase family protein [Paraburkholderia bannensis]|uniref:histidine phosphatase family protein n=1 Tax=Paraburkholderia bannensis TaxID=765414 RepID=UPI002AC36DBD|nr:histidine phosphatase family protein [Paraburkholderia bannensis]
MKQSRYSLGLGRLAVMLAAQCFAAAGGLYASAGVAHAASALGNVSDNAADNANVTTLIFVRHGEKPAEGLGQLDCKGLNRALALPAVIAAKYGKPDAVYAPDPGEQKDDRGHAYYYVRPLATVEPTAIQFGLPIQTPYGHSHTDALEKTLLDPSLRNRTVLIGWEHREIETMVRKIVAGHGGAASDVPKWKSADFDSIYVVRVDWSSGTPVVRFKHDREDLDGVSDECPCAGLPAPKPSAQ